MNIKKLKDIKITVMLMTTASLGLILGITVAYINAFLYTYTYYGVNYITFIILLMFFTLVNYFNSIIQKIVKDDQNEK
jgi:hypothetical protein